MIITIDGEPYNISDKVARENGINCHSATTVDVSDGCHRLLFTKMKHIVALHSSEMKKVETGNLGAFEV